MTRQMSKTVEDMDTVFLKAEQECTHIRSVPYGDIVDDPE